MKLQTQSFINNFTHLKHVHFFFLLQRGPKPMNMFILIDI